MKTPTVLRERMELKRERLRELGYRSYAAYLRSNHWERVRRDWRISGRPKRCEVCGDREYQLHHRTYERLGAELLSDLQALCERCHSLHHQLEREGHETIDFSPERAAQYAEKRTDRNVEKPRGEPTLLDKHSRRAKAAREGTTTGPSGSIGPSNKEQLEKFGGYLAKQSEKAKREAARRARRTAQNNTSRRKGKS